MAKDFQRTDRIADSIKQILAVILQRETNDPRLQSVTITAVEVTRDLAYAKVFFSLLDANKKDDVIKGFEKAKGFLRSCLARELKLRVIPQLQFRYDDSLLRGNYLSQLIAQGLPPENSQSDEEE